MGGESLRHGTNYLGPSTSLDDPPPPRCNLSSHGRPMGGRGACPRLLLAGWLPWTLPDDSVALVALGNAGSAGGVYRILQHRQVLLAAPYEDPPMGLPPAIPTWYWKMTANPCQRRYIHAILSLIADRIPCPPHGGYEPSAVRHVAIQHYL